MTSPGVEPWFSFQRLGKTWRVSLVDPDQSDALYHRDQHCCGLTVYEHRRILINAALDRQGQAETLLHELMHAALASDELSRATEEDVIDALDLPLSRMLHTLGFRVPPRPRAAARLEQRARRKAAQKEAQDA